MNVLPVITRELRMRSRQSGTYWTRFVVGFVGGLVSLLQLLADASFGGTATGGSPAFQGLVIAAFVICCGGCLATSDVISWERREGTLGLLFLTRVRSLDVLLGKLASAGLVSLFGLAAFLPMLMLPVLSGGVTGGEAFRKGLMLLDTLFLALAAGLWASARGVEWFKTARAAVGMVLAILLMPMLIELAVDPFRSCHDTVRLFSPLAGMETAGDLAFRTAPSPFWISLGLIQLLAWLLLIHAAVRLRRSLLDPRESPPAVGTGVTLLTPRGASRGRGTSLTDATEPIGWLVRRQKGVRLMIWGAVLVGAVFYVSRTFLFHVIGPGAWALGAETWSLALFGSIVTGSIFAWAASRFFMESRRTGELELLVTTPLGARTIVSAQWNSLKQMLRWPLVVLLSPMVLQMVFILASGDPWRTGGWFIPYTVSIILNAINTVAGVVVLCWLGMWFGLKARTQGGVIVRAVAWARAVPFGLGLVFSYGFAILLRPIAPPMYAMYLVSSWLPGIATLVFYLWLLNRIQRRLLGELRDAQPLTRSLREACADGLIAVRRARHWTPS